MRALIVGTGPTGAGICRYLLKASSAKGGLLDELVVCDKARGPGGRFATHRFGDDGESRTNRRHRADTGAQYISHGAGPSPPDLEVYEELEHAGVIRSMGPRTIRGDRGIRRNFVAPKGISSVPAYLIESAVRKERERGDEGADVSVRYSTRLIGLGRVPAKGDVTSFKWSATFETYGEDGGVCTPSDLFDVVFLTIPTTQLLQDVRFDAHLEKLLDPHRPRLESANYSRRFAVVAHYDDRPEVLRAADWTAAYVEGQKALRYVSAETRKMCCDEDDTATGTEATTLLLHSSVPYAIEAFDTDRDEVRDQLLHDLDRFLGRAMPKPSYVKVHRWKYSQCKPPTSGVSSATIAIGDGVYIGGDGLVGSNFDNCLHSAKTAVRAFVEENAGLK